MKTLSLKVLGCAAVFALLTVTRAQTSDDSQPVPQPDNTPPPDAAAPNVIVVPMPVEAVDTNADSGMDQAPPAPGQGNQPGQTLQPMTPNTGQSNQYQGRNFDRNRGRGGDRRDSSRDQRQLSSGGATDASAFVPPTGASTNGTDEIFMNFHGAPIDEVLNYLSDAAGFIIELDTRVAGTVDVWSTHPVSKDEAVQLLNSVLNKNGYAAIRSGRRLRIMNQGDATHSNIPVIVSNDPATIPDTDEIVTQIIPIRYVQARQLITDLSPLISSRATIMANDAGNSIVVTDTQSNIRHLVEIVKAIDSSAEDVTEVRVFHLEHHDPVEVATLLTTVFADQSGQGGNNQATPIRFGGGGGFRQFFGGGGFGGGPGGGGFGGGGGRGGGGGGQGGGGSQTDRLRQRAHVVAVADQRTASVLVTAPKDLMTEIEQLVTQVDQESPKVAHVSVIHLENADPQQVQKVLQDFQASNGRNSQSSQNSVLMQRENQTSSSSGSAFGSGGTGFGGGGGGTGFGGGGGGGGGFGGGGFRGGGQ